MVRLLDAGMIESGSFVGCRLDAGAGNLAAYGTPALVADVDPTSAVQHSIAGIGTLTGTWGGVTSMLLFPIPSLSTGGAQTTRAINSAWTYTTPAGVYAVDVAYQASAIGALAHLTIDSQAAKGFDSSSGGGVFRVNLDGQPHTVALTYQGDAVLGTALVGNPSDTAGTAGLAAALRLARNGQGVAGATWSFQATSTTAINVLKNGTSVGSLGVGQSSDSLVTGCTLTLVAGSWDATSQAQATTTAPTLTIVSATTYSALAPDAAYTSPVLDSGAFNTEWPLMEFTQGATGAAAPAISFGVGDSPTPDASWTWATPSAQIVPDSGGTFQRVVCGMPGTRTDGTPLRGRYAQFVGSLAAPARIWVSDVALWTWRPEDDPFAQRLFAPQRAALAKPVGRAVWTSLAAFAALLDEAADEALAAGSIQTATGPNLAAIGADLGLAQLPGEPAANYRARLTFVSAGKGSAGAVPFLEQVLSGAFGCAVQVSRVPRAASAFALGSSPLGSTALGKTRTGYWRFQVLVPFDAMTVAPETAAQIAAQLRPAGALMALIFV